MGGTLAQVTLPSATTGSPAYNVNNELTAWNGSTLSYDLNGNMTSDGIRAYTWNARDQLTAIGSTTFLYDGVGRRAQNGAGVSFVYDGLNPVQEIVGGSARANLLTGGLDEYFARTDAGGTASLLTDALGSTVALADSTGAVQTQCTYEPFGGTTSSGASSTNAFQYTGRENDGSGMYYYRARYYDASLQRFISEDPIGLEGGQTDFYVYVGNNPIDWTDSFCLQGSPTGRTPSNLNPPGGGGGRYYKSPPPPPPKPRLLPCWTTGTIDHYFGPDRFVYTWGFGVAAVAGGFTPVGRVAFAGYAVWTAVDGYNISRVCAGEPGLP